MLSVKLHNSIKDIPPRGGAAICETDDYIIIFGGADREQTSYQDLVAYKKSPTTVSTPFAKYNSVKGDVPMPRSGHTLTPYGPYVFLFGGIDFSEEAVYNDIYILDTKTWEWHYVGEKGVEIPARNAHSTCVVRNRNNHDDAALVIFGGASPEHGPMGDAYYALLPPMESIDPASIYLDWQPLPSSTPAPSPREMHASCSRDQDLWISGGRDLQGLRSDVWRLTYEGSSSFVWSEEKGLPMGRCAHTMAALQDTTSTATSTSTLLCVFGGFTEAGSIDGEFFLLEQGGDWAAALAPSHTLPSPRFGHAMCALSCAGLGGLRGHSLYGPLLQRSGVQAQGGGDVEGPGSVLLFGGTSADMEFGDLWLCLLSPK